LRLLFLSRSRLAGEKQTVDYDNVVLNSTRKYQDFLIVFFV